MKSGKTLSVIVPAYNAERFIANNLNELKTTLDQSGYAFEIICVVDGNVDKTLEKARNVANKYQNTIKVFSYKKNRGKGYAVRLGFSKGKGDIVGFLDAGGEIDPTSFLDLLKVQNKNNSDFVIGSKRHPKSKVSYPLKRKIISSGYMVLVKLLFNFPISDTQAGIKLYKRKVIKKILTILRVDGYAFDVEMISASLLSGFKNYAEAPIRVRKSQYIGESTIESGGYIKSVANMFIDTINIFYRHRVKKLPRTKSPWYSKGKV